MTRLHLRLPFQNNTNKPILCSRSMTHWSIEVNNDQRNSSTLVFLLSFEAVPMETLSLTEPTIVNLLHYLSPSRFYVYLPEKLEDYRLVKSIWFRLFIQSCVRLVSHRFTTNYADGFWISGTSSTSLCCCTRPTHDLAPSNYSQFGFPSISFRYFFDFLSIGIADDSSCMLVYFVDLGFQELVTMENVREIPHEYLHPTAMAIPCRLFRAFPVYELRRIKMEFGRSRSRRISSCNIECDRMRGQRCQRQVILRCGDQYSK